MAICDKDFVFRATLKIQIRYIGLLWGSCMEKRLANCSCIWNINQKIKVFSNPLFLAKIWMVFEWGWAYHSPLGTDCWCLITRSNNIYMFKGVGSQQCQRYYGLCELDGVGHTPGDPESVSLNASYHTEQQYMFDTCFWMVSEILNLTWRRFVCLCWGFRAQSTQWGHVKRGQFT